MNKASKTGLALVCVIILGTINYSTANAQGADCVGYTYTIQEGDYLSKIARKLGDISKWEILHTYNKDYISDPDLIFPGQRILIPPIFFETACPIQKTETISVTTVEEIVIDRQKREQIVVKEKEKKEEQLEKLRNLMAELAEKEAQQKEQAETESNVGLEVDGLIIDETRSKMGKDFFDVFYQSWVAPEEARNFTITIQERPMPSLGTIVSVKVNDRNTYQTRLEPRYEMIQQYGKQAVLYTHQYLKQQPTLKIY